ncbi:MAG: Crp/Fnr family transcriptional regulator [Desulfatibacillaceae bacterium]
MNSSTGKNECITCEFQENLNMLREVSFFAELPLEQIKLVAYLATRETFKQGDYLFHQGDDDGQAFYFMSGGCDLVREGCGENGEMVVGGYEPGDFIGGFALLGSMPRVFSLRAGSETMCLVLGREKFAKAMEPFPEVLPRVLQAVIDGVRHWEERFCRDPGEMCEYCRDKVGVSLL